MATSLTCLLTTNVQMKISKSLFLFATFLFVHAFAYSQSKYYDYTASQRSVQFFDDFNSNTKSWTTGSTDSRSGRVQSGYYYWSSKTSNTATTTKSIYMDANKDFEIEGKFKRSTGGKTTTLQSLLWGCGSSKKNFFGFTADGSFRISWYDGTNYHAYKDWTSNSNISKYGFNKLTIRKVRSTMYFFINSNFVHSMPSKAFFGNNIGFQAAGNASLTIDYLRVSYLSGNKTDYNYVSDSDKAPIFSDQFGDNRNNWVTSNGSTIRTNFSGGAYQLEATGNSLANAFKEIYINSSKNFEIEGSFKRTSGLKTSHLQSLIWGGSSSKRNYFGFTGDGSFRISWYDGSDYQVHKDWTKSSAIKKTGYNKMTIRKIDSKMYFFINGQFVHSMYYKAFFGNKIGFQAPSNTRIDVDYLKVNYINKSGGGGGLVKKKTDYDYIPYAKKETSFHDAFNSNVNDWSTGSSGNSSGSISNGAYTWKSYAEKSAWTTHKKISIDETRDFEIEAKIKYVTGSTTSGIMLEWGKSNSNSDNFNFEFNANGKFWIGRYYDKDYVASKSWTYSSHINKYDYNTMTIRKLGANYYFFINEQHVHTMPFQAFYGDKIGFTAPAKTTIKIDDLRISYLDDKKEPTPTFNAAPTIAITEPSNVSSRGFDVVEAKSVKVAGRAKDSDGISKVTVNGTRASINSDGTFSAYVYLADGSNEIKVVATDNKMKSATKNFKLNYKEAQPITDDDVAKGEKRLALVIGNGAYSHAGALRNPVNDARAMKTKLEALGFKVLKYENCDQRTIKRAIDEFGRQLQGYDVGLFFYAGHGMQVSGANYLIPTDALLENPDEVEYDCVKADRVLAKMESAGTKTNLVILDACRNNPFARSWSRSGGGGNGLAFMNAPQGSLIAYATAPGNTASDGSGANGMYTAALLKEMSKPGLTILEMFQNVRSQVINQSQGKQTPWESTSLIGNFYFKKQ